MSIEYHTYQDKVSKLQRRKERLETRLKDTQDYLHEEALKVLGSDGKQPLDLQSEKIVDFIQQHEVDGSWLYPILNSIIRARMKYPFPLNEGLRIEIEDDQFGLSKDSNLLWAVSRAYHPPSSYANSNHSQEILDVIPILNQGYQNRERSEIDSKSIYNPQRASVVFLWLKENLWTLRYFSQLRWEDTLKYLSKEL